MRIQLALMFIVIAIFLAAIAAVVLTRDPIGSKGQLDKHDEDGLAK